MIQVYSRLELGWEWLQRFEGRSPLFACVLGFTATGLIPGISAAGATPADREYTAIADAEFLYNGPQPAPRYPLPPLQAGASPVLISRAVVAAQNIPVYLFNAGLLHPPSVPCIHLKGAPARCLTQGKALDYATVKHLLKQGLILGKKLAAQTPQGYLILGECVVGGTTTALAVLMALGWDAAGKVNSSYPTCNHDQKLAIVKAGLAKAVFLQETHELNCAPDPLEVVAAVGDPMQVVVAGMAIAASRTCGVLLAGGTQMLAVYALAQSIARTYTHPWQPDQVAIGTTRWVAEDPTGDTVGLAKLLNAPLLATQLNFTTSRYAQLRAYEQGYVKEGVGAGGCAIAAHLYQRWEQAKLIGAIEALAERLERVQSERIR
ncbi:MAG: TIGR00303 family protein [Leptolyngbyaceae cyanobacterium SL_5_9]|nr:TIGR00303 family protein [Leptolyngbyaceae cyanobacterium SL_5_9]NJO75844.1 TIGR00303 family protein [Leptolyngbyaceae cyanobacterium RM1_406_9]